MAKKEYPVVFAQDLKGRLRKTPTLHELLGVKPNDIKHHEDNLVYVRDVSDIQGILFVKFCEYKNPEKVFDINDVYHSFINKGCCTIKVIYNKSEDVRFKKYVITPEERYTLLTIFVTFSSKQSND